MSRKLGGCSAVPLFVGELGPHVTQCGLGRGLPSYHLDLCIQKYLLRIGRSQKLSVISNHILMSHRNSLRAILVPKLVAMAMPLCLLCMGVSQMSLLIGETLLQNQTLH